MGEVLYSKVRVRVPHLSALNISHLLPVAVGDHVIDCCGSPKVLVLRGGVVVVDCIDLGPPNLRPVYFYK